MAYPGVVGTANGGIAGAGDFTVTPPGSSSGYLALAQWYGELTDLVAPTGWTLVTRARTDDEFTNYGWWTATTSPGSTWNHAVAGYGAAVVVVGYDGALTIAQSAGTNDSTTSPTVTTTEGTMVARLVSNQNYTSAPTIGYPSGHATGQVQRIQAAGGEWFCAAVAHVAQASAGATGTAVWSVSGGNAWKPRAQTLTLTTTAGGTTVTPTGLAGAAALGTPVLTVVLTVTPTGLASVAAVGSPSITLTGSVTPTGVPSAVTLGTPAVTLGALTVTPTGLAATSALGTPSVTAALTVAPSSVAPGSTLGAPTITLGVLTVTPTGRASTATLGNPTIPGTYTWPVALSTNRRYLVDDVGDPWAMRMTSPWGWVAHYNLTDWTAYFENIAGKGFNACLFEVIATANGGGGVNDDGRNYAGALPFVGGNITSLNTTYWTHIQAVVDAANAVGITPVLSVMDGWALDPVFVGKSQADCQAYGTAVGDLMDGKHVLWHFGGDYVPNTNEPWDGATTDLQMRACLTGIRAAGHTEPFTVQLSYDYSFTQQNQFWEREVGGDSGAGWSFVYTYYATYAAVHAAYAWTTQTNQWSGDRNPRPAMFSEANYWGENIGGGAPASEPTTAETIRRQVGWAITAGSPGFGYGDDNWDGSLGAYTSMLDDAPPAQVNDLADRVFSAGGWHLLAPTFTLVTAGGGTRQVGELAEDVLEDDYCTAAVTPDGSLAFVYVPTNTGASARTITLDLAQLGATPAALWYNPVTGATTSAGAGPTYTTPAAHADGARDYLLEVTAAPSSTTITPTGIAPTSTAGAPVVTLGVLTLAPVGVPGGATLGSATVVLAGFVMPAGVAPASAVGVPLVTVGALTVSPTAVPSAASVGAPSVTAQTVLAPTGVPSGAVIGSPGVVLGSLVVALAGIAATSSVGAPRVTSPGGERDITVTIGSPTGHPFHITGPTRGTT